ncbi:MAG: DNA-processing protein DprA [Clostridiales bacterium]|jgi:DNA processing protein|nr:DNA-processing protein DprA [Clostridiales bacterium]
MRLTDELIYFWLSTVDGIGSKKRNLMLEKHPELTALAADFNAGAAFYSKLLGADVYNRARHALDAAYLDKELRAITDLGIGIITPSSDSYPAQLKEIYDYPSVLYYIGDPGLMKTRCVSVVGTRKPSAYGERITKKFVDTLSHSGLTVVSGLATGIDAYAHLQALESGGKTIAVLGSGLKRITPANHSALAAKVADGGLLLSEYEPYFAGAGYSFPQRNRIISGLSEAVLVIEAGEKSGALITAECALEQNRQLFVLPGNADSAMSQGTLNLIRKGQCAMVHKAEHILEDLNIAVTPKYKVSGIQFDFTEAKILDLLEASELNYDRILEAVELPVNDLSNLLMLMELKGLVIKRGNLFYKA